MNLRRMKIKTWGVLGFVLILALIFPGAALAKPATYEACTGDTVSGVVVAVDETTGEITIYNADDGTFCTVVKDTGTYDHPVINLLGQYFEKVSLEDLSTNLETLQVRVNTTTMEITDDTDPDAVQATVIGVADNGDGTYEITFLVAGDTTPQSITTTDSDLYNAYFASLESNTITFDLIVGEDGTTFISDGAVQIGAYHDEGMGLGVLVKLYAMADAFGVPVDELIARFKAGEGIGQLFQDESLGKPDLLGVGHVFQELGKNPGHPDGKNNPSAANKADNPGKGH